MTRTAATRPEVTVGGYWLSSIVTWGGLRTSTRKNGDWEASFTIVADPLWRHPALVYGAEVDVYLGPVRVWAGTLTEPDWDSGQMVALGASRDGDDAISLDSGGAATTVPNTALDQGISRGVLPWTRVDDFGSTAVGEDSDAGGLVKVTSVLDAWAVENDSDWRITHDREVIESPTALSTPDWLILPGSGELGSAADKRADRVFVRYVADASGRLAIASYPASTPAGGIEAGVDVTDRGKMTSTKAGNIAEAEWNKLQGESGWTNGLTLRRGQVLTWGGGEADLSQMRGGQTARLLGTPDPRSLAAYIDVVIDDTDYEWDADEIQANPVGTAARTEDAVLEQVATLAASAENATRGRAVDRQTDGGNATAVLSSVSTAIVSVSFNVTFDAAPEVVATVGLRGYLVNRFNITTTGCDIRVERADGATVTTNVQVSWWAFEDF